MTPDSKAADLIMKVGAGPFIDGRHAASENDATVEVINPSNGRCLFRLSEGHEADVDRAVESCRGAFTKGDWADLPNSTKKRTLHRFADLINTEARVLDEMDAAEMGKPISVAFCNANAAASLVRFYAEALDKPTGDVYNSDRRSVAIQRGVPRGVVAAIVPWNFPTFCAALKVSPALAAGNCVVLKPSEFSSRSAIRLAQMALEAGCPPGAFNVVPGLGHTVGRALALHSDVDMLAFTGSTTVGKLMLQYAGQSNMKVVQAECGGKSPQIIFADGVDLGAAAESIAASLLTNQGQICSVGSRVLVQRSVENELVERVSAQMQQIIMGDALDPRTNFGPLVSAKQCDRVTAYIDTAVAEGVNLVCGGRRALTSSGGFFVEPTLFRDVNPQARIAKEEVFGPVLSVIPFDDEAEAIHIANDTIYGLIAYVWTTCLSTAMRMAKSIHSSVIINAAPPVGEAAGHSPSFEPAGQSGIGTEGGLDGMECYRRRQTVLINHT